MHGQLVPVFVAGKLMGFRRKKNDRLLMFCLRHYGQDAQGRRVTVNYFSSRATAAAPSGSPQARSDTRTSARDARPCRPATGGAESFDVTNSLRDALLPPLPLAGEGRGEGDREPTALAEASVTTIQTSITPGQSNTLTRNSRSTRDDESADILNAFEGVPLDEEAQSEIAKALAACAERRRATPIEDDPDEPFIHIADTNALYLGELESGFEVEDFIPFNPDEPRWQSLGEGGDAEAVAEIVKQIEAQRAEPKPADGEADTGT